MTIAATGKSATTAPEKGRHFLLLQGPCGAFFRELQKTLRRRGHKCTRVVLNGGDLVNSLFGKALVYRRSFADWPAWIAAAAIREGITDLVVYGDCRPYHRAAMAQLKALGIRVHVLEEGYLRPNWVTCEADGVNGNSVFTRLDLDTIDAASLESYRPEDEVQIKGSHIRYILTGFSYYCWTLALTPLFARHVSHRDLDIVGEAALWLGRIFSHPFRKRRTERALRTIERLARPVHLVLLQLNGDSQIKEHSRFSSIRHFVEFCIAEFAASTSSGSLLVFKNHPLDNGVINIPRLIREEAARHGLGDRIFFVETGKLVPLLEKSISVTAINSTACHQALRRGIPTMVLGEAVFNHPQIVPHMRLADFFRLRPRKDIAHYEKLVNLLRTTCQFNGGYYSPQGWRTLLPSLTDAMIGKPPARVSPLESGEVEPVSRKVS
jgi:capsular polysaccharide export protein